VGCNHNELRPEKLGPVKITYEGTADRYLGIPIGLEIDYADKWINVKHKIIATIKRWGNRHSTSIRGRVRVAKNAINSQMWYLIMTIPCTNTYLDEINRLTLEFIWSQRPGASRPLQAMDAYKEVADGGLGIMDARTMRDSLLLGWITRMEKIGNLPIDQRPHWYDVALDLIYMQYRPTIPEMCTKPWTQIWTVVFRPVGESLDYFWVPWCRKHRCFPRIPETKQDAERVVFWYHPILTSYLLLILITQWERS
jgi:hypothetical protein